MLSTNLYNGDHFSDFSLRFFNGLKVFHGLQNEYENQLFSLLQEESITALGILSVLDCQR